MDDRGEQSGEPKSGNESDPYEGLIAALEKTHPSRKYSITAGTVPDPDTPSTPETTPVTRRSKRTAVTSKSKNKKNTTPLSARLSAGKRKKPSSSCEPSPPKKTIVTTMSVTRTPNQKGGVPPPDTSAQTADRPSPSVAPDPFERMQRFIETQFQTTNEKIGDVTQSVTVLNESVRSNSKGLAEVKAMTDRHTKELDGLLGVVAEKDQARQRDIQRIENALLDLREERTRSTVDVGNQVREQIAKEIEKTKAVSASAALRPIVSGSDDKEKKYWIARRTLRCWPVIGATTKEMWQGADLFFRETMDLPLNAVAERDIEHIRRAMPGSRRARVQNEIIVVFKEVCVRDNVASYARNLGRCIDERGFPTAGIRIEIPDFLTGVHQDLQKYGGHLRGLHGNGLKRNVKYDDPNLSLVLDVKLPDSEDWMRLDWALVREQRAEINQEAAATFRRRLTSSTSSAGDGTGDAHSPMATEESRPTSGTNGVSLPRSSTLSRFGRPPSSWGSER